MSLWCQPAAWALLWWPGWRAWGCATARTQNQQDKSGRVSCWPCPASLPHFVTLLQSSPLLFVPFLKCFSHPWEKCRSPLQPAQPLCCYTGTRSPEYWCSTWPSVVPEAVWDTEPLSLPLWALSCPRPFTFHGHPGVPCSLQHTHCCHSWEPPRHLLSTWRKGAEGETTILQTFSEQLPVSHRQRGWILEWVPYKVCPHPPAHGDIHWYSQYASVIYTRN